MWGKRSVKKSISWRYFCNFKVAPKKTVETRNEEDMG
jgi:hypothetical protein